ncbi:MAG: glycoside hydrolase domain-containing protein [Victivallaceae bacterium]
MLKQCYLTSLFLITGLLSGFYVNAGLDTPEKDLLFYVSFDQRIVRADYACGSRDPVNFKETLELRFQPGLNESCAYLRKAGERLSYNALNNFNPKEGTISVWTKAMNWNPKGIDATTTSTFKHIISVVFGTGTGNAVFTLYKYYKGSTFSFLITPSLNSKNFLCSFDGSLLNQGKLHKIDCCWGKGKMSIYIDGKLISSSLYTGEYDKIADSPLKQGNILINPLLWGTKHETYDDLTLIDNVKIFGRALSDAEIKQKYLADSGQAGAIEPSVSINLSGLEKKTGALNDLKVDFNLNSLPAEWQNAISKKNVCANIKVTFGNQILFSKEFTLDQLEFDQIVSGAGSKGIYTAQLCLNNTKTGKKLEFKSEVNRPDTSWLGNSFGKEDFIPAPWTPMEVKNNTVSVWNRTYTFDGPFIASVVAGGAELLASPMTLQINSNGHETAAKFGSPKIAEQRNDYVKFNGVGNAGDIEIKYTNTVWFDGYSHISFELGPKGQKIDSMTLKYTVNPEYSKYLSVPKPVDFNGDKAFEWIGSGPKGFSQIWLTGKVNGFCWSAENEGNWVYEKGIDPIKVLKKTDGAEVMMNIISKPVTLPCPVQYSLGFIATPTRLLPPNYRTFTFSGWNSKICDAVPMGWSGQAFTRYASLIPDQATYNKQITDLADKGISSFPYSSPVGLSDEEPEVKFFQTSWQIPGGAVFPVTDAKDGAKYNQISLSPTPALQDFFANKLERFLSRNEQKIGGVYYDLCHCYYNTNSITDGAFVDAFGRKIPARWTCSGLRESMMRTIKICRKYNKQAIYHAHNEYNPAIHGLSDFWWPGEHLGGELAENPYYYADNMPQRDYATDFSSAQKGVGVINLPVISRMNRKYEGEAGRKPTESMVGRMLLNDVISAQTQCHLPTIERIWNIRKQYKFDAAKFVHFTDNKMYSSDNKNIVGSFYVYPDGKIIAVFCNMTKTEQAATLTIPDYDSAQDMWNNTSMTMQNNKLKLDIPARLFMIVMLQKD